MHHLLFKEAVTSTNLRRIFTDFKWQIGNAEQGGNNARTQQQTIAWIIVKWQHKTDNL